MGCRALLTCALVLLGITATPARSQTIDTALSPHARPPGVRECLRIDMEYPEFPGDFELGDSLPTTDTVRAPAVDARRVATLAFILQRFDDARIETSDAGLVRGRAVVSPGGLLLRKAGWGIGSAVHSEERLIPWAEMESIQVRKGTGAGPVVGGVVGLAIGFSIFMAQVPLAVLTLGEAQPSATPIVVGLVGGATLGWLLDLPGPWQTVYP